MVKRDHNCPICSMVMIRPPTWIGRFKLYCSEPCRVEGATRASAARKFGCCVVDGCAKLATRTGARMCEMHYIRKYRNGTTEYVGGAIPGALEHSGGYLLQSAPGHPRALGGYRAYQHRVVFTDAHGEGPFNCHWCAKVVTWSDMHVDHLDSNPGQ